MSVRIALILSLCLFFPAIAQARVERYALVVGSQRGAAEQVPLQYALRDAERMYEVLRDLGGFDPSHMLSLSNTSAESMRAALIDLNDKIRQARDQPDTQVILVVYYSGHGDVQKLQLGGTELPLPELTQLVRGSAADFRLLILDACRAGSITETRAKGGRVVDPFALPTDQLPGSGLAYLTASSADEDAQESDEIQGSFFTQALVSALLGAADQNNDGAVSLDEAYRYAYDATLRATSVTESGLQHPTFRYDLRGQGGVILSRPREHARDRATLRFPPTLPALIMRGDGQGAVVAELRSSESARTLSLASGRYYVCLRGQDVLYETEIVIENGMSRELRLSDMRQVTYARLVRKGGSARRSAYALYAGPSVRSALDSNGSICWGGAGALAVELEQLSVRLQLSGCGASFANAPLAANVAQYTAQLSGFHTWDLPMFSLSLGLGAGLSLFRQQFETRGRAPDRSSVFPFIVLAAAMERDLTSSMFMRLELAGETHFLRLRGDASAPVDTVTNFAASATLALGLRL